MKQFLTLCVMATLVGCGTSPSPSEEPDALGTSQAAICRGSCTSGYYISSYYCDSGCANPNNCNSAYNGINCVAGDLTGPISICSSACPTGYYATKKYETTDCRTSAGSPFVGQNRVDCSVNPAPGAVPSYTQCGAFSTCASGYHFGSNVHVDDCWFSGNNATVCLAN